MMQELAAECLISLVTALVRRAWAVFMSVSLNVGCPAERAEFAVGLLQSRLCSPATQPFAGGHWHRPQGTPCH